MENQNIKLLADRVLIEPILEENKTESGIILPTTVKNKLPKGLVVVVGPGKTNEPMVVKVGDHVLYDNHIGLNIKFNDKDCLVVRENQILSIL